MYAGDRGARTIHGPSVFFFFKFFLMKAIFTVRDDIRTWLVSSQLYVNLSERERIRNKITIAGSNTITYRRIRARDGVVRKFKK